jgi:para-aminobenzoate synthetase component 1
LKRLTDRLRRITTVRTRTLHLNAPFAETAARFAREAGAVVLLSGGNLDCSRYHMMGLRPWLSLVGRYGETEVFIDGDSVKLNQSPLDVLETVLAHCRMAGDNSHSPVTAGLFGYLAYDLKNDLERLPRTAVDDLGLPRLYLSAPSIIVVQDKRKGTTTLHAPVRQGQSVAQVDAAIDTFVPTLAEPPAPPGDFSGFGRSFESNFSRAAYMAAVQTYQGIYRGRRCLPGEHVPAV